MQNLITNYTQRPHIHSICIVMKPSLFWSNVLLCTSNRFHDDFLGAETEICYFDGWNGLTRDILGFEENVLGFKIPMGDSMIVQLLNPLTNLQDALESVFFSQFVIFGSIECIPQRSSLTKFSNVPNRGRSLDNVINLENVLIFDLLEFFIDNFLFFDVLTFPLISVNSSDSQWIIDFHIKDTIDLHRRRWTCAKLPSPISSALFRSNSFLKYLEVTFICIVYKTQI